MIGRSGERWSGISVLAARHDDDDDNCKRHTLAVLKHRAWLGKFSPEIIIIIIIIIIV